MGEIAVRVIAPGDNFAFINRGLKFSQEFFGRSGSEVYGHVSRLQRFLSHVDHDRAARKVQIARESRPLVGGGSSCHKARDRKSRSGGVICCRQQIPPPWFTEGWLSFWFH